MMSVFRVFRNPFRLQRLLRRSLLLVVGLGVLYFVLRYDFPRIQENNYALSPAFAPGEKVILDRWCYIFHKVRRNDVVAFRAAWGGQGEVIFFSRVLGIPGDRVGSKGENIVINGRVTDYEKGKFPEGIIGKDQFLVLNDKADYPVPDSRFFGFISRDQIIGRVLCYLPF